MVSQVKPANVKRSVSQQSQSSAEQAREEDSSEELDAEDEVYIRDAYLVFRSFCNLSTKVLPPEALALRYVLQILPVLLLTKLILF